MIYIIARTTRNATARSRTALQESELDRTASSTEIATNEPQTNVPIGLERSRNVWLVFDVEQALTNRVELALFGTQQCWTEEREDRDDPGCEELCEQVPCDFFASSRNRVRPISRGSNP